jgi:iron uptake system component EfeO
VITAHHRLAKAAAVGTLLLAATACADKADGNEAGAGGAPTISVTSTDDECTLSVSEAPSGNVVFDVRNDGSQVTEFYLYGSDGEQIVSEVENIGPGLSRTMVVVAKPGSYFTACKPGQTGDGIRAEFTVTDSGVVASGDDDIAPLLTQATDQYAVYVKDEVKSLVAKTDQFAALYIAGDDDAARALYPDARTHWERIEPVAESFGDLDPRLDLREADLEEGQQWTGWHRIEKDLWPPADQAYVAATDAERIELADQLVADTAELASRVDTLTYSPDRLGNGAKELLDEVATGKVTGEEEIWSGTDLWDFQANVEGAQRAFEVLRPVLDVKNPELGADLAAKFDALQTKLDEHREGDGFVLYSSLSDAEVKSLADAVNALSEPLSELTAAVVL